MSARILSPVLWRAWGLLLLLVVLVPMGCQELQQVDAQQAAGEPAAAPSAPSGDVDLNELDDDTFLASLADQALVTVDQCYRAMVILADGEDPFGSFEERRASLEGRDIARAAWGLKPDRNIDKGSAAFMVCRILQIKGGLNRILFGSWGLGDRRYAYRELVHRNLIRTPGVDYQPITGGELVALLGVADEYMSDTGVYEQEPVELTVPGQARGDQEIADDIVADTGNN
jgi:hypothetical protein